jgi:hypothetical protein
MAVCCYYLTKAGLRPRSLMLIYLRHPHHGTKIASMELEAELDEQNGWKRYNPDTPSAPEAAAPANELEVKRRRSRTTVEAAA